MFVLEVIPLSKTAPAEPLSYRSRTKLPVGTIVNVPLRRKVVPGLVVEVVPVAEAKAMLKSASFSLSKSAVKRNGKRKGESGLPRAFVNAAKMIADYHATSLGAVLSALLIPVLTDELPTSFAKGSGFEIERLEVPMSDRLTRYQTYLHNAKGTTILVIPTLTELHEWSHLLHDHKPILLSGALSPKKRDIVLEALFETPPSLIITTPHFAALPLRAINRIILERMSAGTYTLLKRPYLDVRYALTELARARDIPLTYSDYPLPLEYRAHPEKPLTTTPAGTITIYDARRKDDEKFEALPLPLQNEIEHVLKKKGRVAVLAIRRGYAPVVVCRDCGTTVTDEYGRNLSFSMTDNERIFRSADGTTVEKAHTKCKNCDSWNLMPLGIGIERVEEELKKAFPHSPMVTIDADSTSAKAFADLREKIKQPGTLIVGTESMLPWLSSTEPVDLAVIASADSLLALPFWRSRERFVRVGLMLHERAKRLIVATRKIDDEIFSALESPTASSFWSDESQLRKMLGYPPFGTLIVFHVEGARAILDRVRTDIRKACEPHILIELPERHIGRTQLRATSVLHLRKSKKDSWPLIELSTKLSHLSPAVRIHIDSETLW